MKMLQNGIEVKFRNDMAKNSKAFLSASHISYMGYCCAGGAYKTKSTIGGDNKSFKKNLFLLSQTSEKKVVPQNKKLFDNIHPTQAKKKKEHSSLWFC